MLKVKEAENLGQLNSDLLDAILAPYGLTGAIEEEKINSTEVIGMQDKERNPRSTGDDER